jgi:hypothetical protein
MCRKGRKGSYNDADHNLVVPNIMTSNVYRDLAIQFVHRMLPMDAHRIAGDQFLSV